MIYDELIKLIHMNIYLHVKNWQKIYYHTIWIISNFVDNFIGVSIYKLKNIEYKVTY